MTADRRSRLTVRPNGALLDEGTMRWWMGEMDRRAKRPTVARLSASDPMCVAVEADSRKRAAA